MSHARKPPLSQKSIDFIRANLDLPQQAPEHPSWQHRLTTLLDRITIVASLMLAIGLACIPLIALADFLLGTSWIESWLQVFAAVLLVLLLRFVPVRIRTAPIKAVLLALAIVTIAHTLYLAVVQHRSVLADHRTLILLWGLMFAWKVLDLMHEYRQVPHHTTGLFLVVAIVGTIASFSIVVLYVYPALLNTTQAALDTHPFPTVAFITYVFINLLHDDTSKTNV